MNREKAEKLLAALIFDDLDEQSKANLLEYLQTDDELRERLADMRMAAKVTSDALQHGPDPVLGKKRLKRLERLARRRSSRTIFFTRRRLAAAAAIVAAVLLPALLILPALEDSTTVGPALGTSRMDWLRMGSSSESAAEKDIEFTGGTSHRYSPSRRIEEYGGGVYSVGEPVISNSIVAKSAPEDLLGDSVAAHVVVDSADSTSGFRSHYYKAPETGGMGLSAPDGGQVYASDAWRKGRSSHELGAYVPSEGTSPATWETARSGLENTRDDYLAPTGGPDKVVANWHYDNGNWHAELDGGDDSAPAYVVASGTQPPQPGRTAGRELRDRFRATYGFDFKYSPTDELKSNTWSEWFDRSSPIEAQGQAPGNAAPPQSTVALLDNDASMVNCDFSDSEESAEAISNSAVAGNVAETGQNVPFRDGHFTEPADIGRKNIYDVATGAAGAADVTGPVSAETPKPTRPPLEVDKFETRTTAKPAPPGRNTPVTGPEGTVALGQTASGTLVGEETGAREYTTTTLPKIVPTEEAEITDGDRSQRYVLSDGGDGEYGRSSESLDFETVLKSLDVTEEARQYARRSAESDEIVAQIIDRLGKERDTKLDAYIEHQPDITKKDAKKETAGKGIPLLGDIPITGEVFRMRQKARESSSEEHAKRQGQVQTIVDYVETKAEPGPMPPALEPEGKPVAPADAPDLPAGGLYDGKATTEELTKTRRLSGAGSYGGGGYGGYGGGGYVGTNGYAGMGRYGGGGYGGGGYGGAIGGGKEITQDVRTESRTPGRRGEDGGEPITGPGAVDENGREGAAFTGEDRTEPDAGPVGRTRDRLYTVNGDSVTLNSGDYGGAIRLEERMSKIRTDPTALQKTKRPDPLDSDADGSEDESSLVTDEYEVIELKYADPRAVQDSMGNGLMDLLSTKNLSGGKSSPEVRIEPLNETRQIVLFGDKDVREQAKKLIEAIDKPRPQVKIEVTKVEVEEDVTDLPEAARFKLVPVNPWVMTRRDSLSTFALDVDTASFTMCRRYIRGGFLPPPGAVRMEEFINYFNYAYPQRSNPTFAVHAQAARSPFAGEGKNLTLLKIGVKARTLGRDQQRAAHLIIVVDASASMDQPDRLPLIQKALGLLVDKLSPADSVSLITCANEARLHLEAVSTDRRKEIRQAIDAIQPSGPTNLLEGLKLGYATARKKFDPKKINHVVLCSDGVANVGQTQADEVLKAVSADRKQGIAITCVGVGYGAYNDAFLESLANRGDGSYVFLDSMRQARRVFVDQLSATLHNVAKDARIQVEFDPKHVRRYRLIGYENRDIEDKKFRDDTIDAGEVGSGQCSTALYELELTAQPSPERQENLGTVFVRYKNVETGRFEEISEELSSTIVRRLNVENEPRFFLAAVAARFAEILRESEHAKNARLEDLRRLAEQVSLALPVDQDVRRLAELIRKAENLPKAP